MPEQERAESGDEALWHSAVGGDPDAFATLFDRHIDRVHRHARRFVVNIADAEDVTAMVFLEAWRSRRRVRLVDGSIIAWLLVTATNMSRNVARSRVRHEKALGRVRAETVRDHADAVLDRLALDQMRRPVRTAFDSLSRSDQEVLALCVIEELRPREVAVMMRVPSGTVRTRLNRAKRRLRDAVESGRAEALEGWAEA